MYLLGACAKQYQCRSRVQGRHQDYRVSVGGTYSISLLLTWEMLGLGSEATKPDNRTPSVCWRPPPCRRWRRRWSLTGPHPLQSGCGMIPLGRVPPTSHWFSAWYPWLWWTEGLVAGGWWSCPGWWSAGPACRRGEPACGGATPTPRPGGAGRPGQCQVQYCSVLSGESNTPHTFNISLTGVSYSSPLNILISLFTFWELASQHFPVNSGDSHKNIWEMPNVLKSAPPWDWSWRKFLCNPSLIIGRFVRFHSTTKTAPRVRPISSRNVSSECCLMFDVSG